MKTLLIVLLLATPAHAGWFGPSTYEECILENMKDVKSDRAAIIIHRACRNQFPEPKKEPPKRVVAPPNVYDQFNKKKPSMTLEQFDAIGTGSLKKQ